MVAVVGPVAVAERPVGGFGVVYAGPVVPAVPEPTELLGVSVNPPYCWFTDRPPRVYDVPVMPEIVVYPDTVSVNDVAPVPEFQLSVSEDVVLEET
jgi:hypothetical protein